jgi:solute carrier family 6 amino acid/orphan transporter-like 15/16/17/18/20
MFIEGVPLMLLELAIGQKMRCTPMKLWKNIHPALVGIGVCCLSVSMFLCVYYVVVISWCFFYFFSSMQPNLPWQSKELCTKHGAYNALKSRVDALSSNLSRFEDMKTKSFSTWQDINTTKSLLNQTQYEFDNFQDCCVIDPQQWFFYTSALDISTDIEDYSNGLNGKLVGCFILTWIIVYLCVIKGIKSTGKVGYSPRVTRIVIETLWNRIISMPLAVRVFYFV